MSRLENAARRAMGGDSVMDGREPIKTADIIEKYPDGIRITGLAMNTYNGSTYPVFTFVEEPSKYFSGATALTRLAEGLIEDYDGDMSALNKDLADTPLVIKLVKTRTKRGYNFTKVVIIGTETVDPETGEVIFG